MSKYKLDKNLQDLANDLGLSAPEITNGQKGHLNKLAQDEKSLTDRYLKDMAALNKESEFYRNCYSQSSFAEGILKKDPKSFAALDPQVQENLLSFAVNIRGFGGKEKLLTHIVDGLKSSGKPLPYVKVEVGTLTDTIFWKIAPELSPIYSAPKSLSGNFMRDYRVCGA